MDLMDSSCGWGVPAPLKCLEVSTFGYILVTRWGGSPLSSRLMRRPISKGLCMAETDAHTGQAIR